MSDLTHTSEELKSSNGFTMTRVGLFTKDENGTVVDSFIVPTDFDLRYMRYIQERYDLKQSIVWKEMEKMFERLEEIRGKEIDNE